MTAWFVLAVAGLALFGIGAAGHLWSTRIVQRELTTENRRELVDGNGKVVGYSVLSPLFFKRFEIVERQGPKELGQ